MTSGTADGPRLLSAQMVVFSEVKRGNPPWEWEDCAGYDEGGAGPDRARLIVVDGATEAYDSIRWVSLLVRSFLGLAFRSEDHSPPELAAADIEKWFVHLQERWSAGAPRSFANIFEERKFRTAGSFATMICCHLDGLVSGRPRWSAAALGDTVLFHVRSRHHIARFPDVEQFGINPSGVFTAPVSLPRMLDDLQLASGALAPGDQLFIATDALAEWMINRCNEDEERLWWMLGSLADGPTFSRLVDEQRSRGDLKNDDVTLLRVELLPQPVAAPTDAPFHLGGSS